MIGESSFQPAFNQWLDQGLSQPVPASVIAFAFNLYKPWAIEVIGSDTYIDADPDWACHESFRPELEQLPLPDLKSATREEVLEHAQRLVTAYLQRPSPGSAKLRQAQAVAVGFVDADLHRLWPR